MKAIEAKIEGGGKVLIQVDDPPEVLQARRTGGATAGVAEPARVLAKLEDAADTIADTCRTLFGRMLAKFDDGRPDELGLEFGVTLGGEAGIPFVTKGTAEATFKVTATWKFDKG